MKAQTSLLPIIYSLILISELSKYARQMTSSLQTGLKIRPVIFVISFWIGWRKYAGTKSRLVSILFRDGLGYFVFVTGESLARNIYTTLI